MQSTALDWSVSGAVNVGQTAGPISFNAATEGTALVTAFDGKNNVQFPVIIRKENVAPTIDSVPSLTGINEGQTISVGTPTIGTDYQLPILVDGSSIGNVDISDANSSDVANIVTTATITDPLGVKTSLIHHALEFDDDAIELSNRALSGATNVTTAFWLKTSEPGAQTILSGANDSETNEFLIELISGTELQITVNGNSVSWTGLTLDDGIYRHLAITRNMATGVAELFINGQSQGVPQVLSGQQPLEIDLGRLVLGQTQLAVGGHFEANKSLVASLDEFAIWDRALSGQEIADLIDGELNTADSTLRLYLPFDEGAGRITTDRGPLGLDVSLAESPGFYEDGSITSFRNEPILYLPFDGAAAETTSPNLGTLGSDFDAVLPASGVSGGILGQVQNAIQFTSPAVVTLEQQLPTGIANSNGSFSVEFWFNVDESSSAAQLLFQASDPSDSQFSVQITPLGRLAIGGDISGFHDTDFLVSPDTWYHVIAVNEANAGAGTARIYVNGSEVSSASTAGIQNSPVSISLGQRVNGIHSFQGLIDEVAVFASALSPSDVAVHFAEGILIESEFRPVSTPIFTNSIPSGIDQPLKFVDNGEYTLTVTADDGDGGFAESVTTFDVGNVAPKITDLNFAGRTLRSVGDELRFNARNVVDPGSNDTFTYLWEVITNNGQTVLSSSDVEFEFTPQFSGVYTVMLTVTDSDGDASATQIEEFEILPNALISVPADNPTAGSIAMLTAEGSSVLAPAGPLRGTGYSVSRGYQWSVTAPDETVQTYDTTDLNFIPVQTGNHTVTLTITDTFTDAFTDPANPVDEILVQTSDPITLTVNPATTISVVAPIMTALEGDVLTFSLDGLNELVDAATRQVNWSVTGGTINVVPVADQTTYAFTAPDEGTFTVSATITDTLGGTSFTRTATAVGVSFLNARPVLVADALQGVESSAVTLVADVVDASAADTHDFLIEWGDGQTSTGNVVDGQVTADHTYLQDGTYTVTITVTDTADNETQRIVTTQALIANSGPVAVDDTLATDADASIIDVNLASNDTDAGTLDVLTVVSTDTISSEGALLTLVDGLVTYDPSSSASIAALPSAIQLTDTFTYIVSDQFGDQDTATATVTVTGVNDAPIASDDLRGIAENDPGAITGSLVSNDSDVDTGATLTITEIDTETNDATDIVGNYGTLDWNADGSFSYTLDNLNPDVDGLTAGETLQDVFTYTVQDDQGASATANFIVTISGQNDAPVAIADSQTADLATASSFTGFALDNDSDVDNGDEIEVVSVQGNSAQVGQTIALPSGANVQVRANGRYEYDPNGAFDYLAAGQTFDDQITYTIRDSAGAEDTATITVTVVGQNDSPTGISLSNTTIFDSAENGDTVASVLAVDVDDSDTLTVTLTDNAGGRFSYDAGSGELQVADAALLVANETYLIFLTVTDAAGATSDHVFGIDVLPAPITPDLIVNLAAIGSVDVTVQQLGDEVQIVDNTNTGAILHRQPVASTSSITINGADEVDENITIDFSTGGFFQLSGDIVVNAGAGGNDQLTILGDVASTNGQYVSENNGLGNAHFVATDNSDSTTIRFTDVEPLSLLSIRQLSFEGTLDVGNQTLTLDSPDPVNLSSLTQIAGGTIASTGLTLGNGETLEGFGTVSGPFAGETGSVLRATGDLTVGDAGSNDGFSTDGAIHVDANAVSLLDANQAVLGTLTDLGNATAAGTLLGTNGFLVNFGNNVTGYGTLESPEDIALLTTVNGTISGDSLTNPITLPGYYNGVGSLNNVNLTGTYSPGFSPATTVNGNVAYSEDSQLVVELGGTTFGSNDFIIHTGVANLGGELRVELINGFVPQVGDSFVLLTANAGIDGTFNSQSLPLLPEDYSWKVTYEATEVIGTVIEAPQVQSVVINGGDVQRSFLDEVQITFTTVVDIDDAAGSVFEIINRATGASVSLIETVSNDSGRTVVTLQFSGDETTSRGSSGASLNDGNYELTIDAMRVSFGRHQLDGNADGTGGDDFVYGDEAADGFFRLFGDKDADRDVDIQDLARFGGTFRRTSADPAFNEADDFDGNGVVDIQDLAQFGQRFRTVLQF